MAHRLGPSLRLVKNSFERFVSSNDICDCVLFIFKVVEEGWLVLIQRGICWLGAQDGPSIPFEHLHFEFAIAAQRDVRLLRRSIIVRLLLVGLHWLLFLHSLVGFWLLSHVFCNEKAACLSCSCLGIIISLALSGLIIFVSDLGFFVRIVLRASCRVLDLRLVIEYCRVKFDCQWFAKDVGVWSLVGVRLLDLNKAFALPVIHHVCEQCIIWFLGCAHSCTTQVSWRVQRLVNQLSTTRVSFSQ